MSAEPWKPSSKMDEAVRGWMKEQGLQVASTRYYEDDEVYAWRHDTPGGSPTLWISRPVLEDYAAADLIAGLQRLGVADRMRSAPKSRFLVVDEDGDLRVTPWARGPHKGA
jgi:hypothetical protein